MADSIETLLANREIKLQPWDHYGLKVYTTELAPGEYAYAATDEEADDAARAYIADSVWAFLPEFLLDYLPAGIPIKVIRLLQEECEDANEPLIDMIKGQGKWDRFLNDALAAAGREHFLSSYDGRELFGEDVGLASGYAYRIG